MSMMDAYKTYADKYPPTGQAEDYDPDFWDAVDRGEVLLPEDNEAEQ